MYSLATECRFIWMRTRIEGEYNIVRQCKGGYNTMKRGCNPCGLQPPVYAQVRIWKFAADAACGPSRGKESPLLNFFPAVHSSLS